MRWCVFLLLLVPAAASAQAAGAPAQVGAPPRAAAPTLAPPAGAPAPVARSRDAAPEARRGFQMHFVPLTALSFPFGEATSGRGDLLSARYGWQWAPIEIGLGAKVIDELYLGAYVNVGVGWEGSDPKTEAHCEVGDGIEDDVTCSSVSAHAGIEARYTFTPADDLSGWLGYGIGFASASQSISDAGRYSETSTLHGLDLARISGGLDFRLKRGFGMGPYLMAFVGRYTHERTEIRNLVTSSADIDQPAIHVWLSVGLRMVIFP